MRGARRNARIEYVGDDLKRISVDRKSELIRFQHDDGTNELATQHLKQSTQGRRP